MKPKNYVKSLIIRNTNSRNTLILHIHIYNQLFLLPRANLVFFVGPL